MVLCPARGGSTSAQRHGHTGASGPEPSRTTQRVRARLGQDEIAEVEAAAERAAAEEAAAAEAAARSARLRAAGLEARAPAAAPHPPSGDSRLCWFSRRACSVHRRRPARRRPQRAGEQHRLRQGLARAPCRVGARSAPAAPSPMPCQGRPAARRAWRRWWRTCCTATRSGTASPRCPACRRAGRSSRSRPPSPSPSARRARRRPPTHAV